MKIHGPSLAIGAGTSCAVVFIFFVLLNPGFSISSSENKLKNSDEHNFQMSLLLDNSSPTLGSTNATITMVEFGDYQCFYCNKFYHETESDLVKNYVDTGKVKLIFKDYTIIGQDSVNAAHAAHCAQEKGKFWEYHDKLYDQWNGENTGWASSKNLLEFAKQVGISDEDFNSCMSDARYGSVIQNSLSDAKTLGLTGTPDFFIIGSDKSVTKVVGAQPFDVFDEIFKSKLKT